jgi:hypothetical protein
MHFFWKEFLFRYNLSWKEAFVLRTFAKICRSKRKWSQRLSYLNIFQRQRYTIVT